MRRRGVFGLVIAVVGFALPINLLNNSGYLEEAKADGTPAMIINEVAWAGSPSSSADEWIELYNPADATIQITPEWKIEISDSETNIEIALYATDVVGGGFFLIANRDYDYQYNKGESVLNVPANLVAPSIDINSAFTIKLIDPAEEVIDQAGNGGGSFPGSALASMERNDVYAPGELASSWHAATSAINLDSGTAYKGTPKAINSPAADPAPIVDSISPTSASIDTILEIKSITGDNFSISDSTKVELREGDQTIPATNVNVLTPMLIDRAKFDLRSATVGKWDVVVINPDGQEGALHNALELTEPEEDRDELDYSNDIIINEIYPKPSTSSNDEFIELYNKSNTAVDLKGWQLDDQSPGGSAPYIITDNQIIPPNGYLSFTKAVTHISLNDSGDSARLLQPNGSVSSQVAYDSAMAGQSYAWLDNRWQWTLRITKNAKNVLELPEADESDNEEVSKEQLVSDDNPRGIELELSLKSVGASAAILEWQLDEWGYIDEVKIFVSQKSGERGELNRVAAARQREAEVIGLKPNTKYFFTITGDYNAYTATSNQVSDITKTGTPAQKINSDGVSGQLLITELLPNPGGGDSEWIEIYNPTDQPIIITGWKLMDKSKRCYTFSALDFVEIQAEDNTEDDQNPGDIIISPKQYLLFDQDVTGIHLNNSGGEEVYLLDGDDNIIDTVTYASTAKRDYAYVLAPNEKWFWTEEATPGAANNISFAGEMEDGGIYLTPSGAAKSWGSAGWLSLLLSAIILVGTKRYVKTNYQK